MTGFFLTLTLLALSFLLKLYLNRKPKVMDILKAISELPVDIMFTSMAFIISYRIAEVAKWVKEETKITGDLDMNTHFVYLVVYLIITLIVILMWRFSCRYLKEENWVKSGILIFISYLIAFGALINALLKLNGVV